MKGTELLRYLGEGLWLENTRNLLDESVLKNFGWTLRLCEYGMAAQRSSRERDCHYHDEPRATEVPPHATILHRAVRTRKITIRNGHRRRTGRAEVSDPSVPKVKEISHGQRI
jgi:hypothetical protein